MRPRISIRGCVRPLVRRSVGPYVCHAFVKNAWNWEFYVQKWSWRHTKSWITSKQLSSTSTTKGGYCRTQISSSHLSHLYKRICPKMLEDASLAAGPCFILLLVLLFLLFPFLIHYQYYFYYFHYFLNVFQIFQKKARCIWDKLHCISF